MPAALASVTFRAAYDAGSRPRRASAIVYLSVVRRAVAGATLSLNRATNAVIHKLHLSDGSERMPWRSASLRACEYQMPAVPRRQDERQVLTVMGPRMAMFSLILSTNRWTLR